MNKVVIVLVALYRYQNSPIRIMQPLLENIDGIKPYTIFFKNCEPNIFKDPTAREEQLFLKLITMLNPALVGFSVLSPYVPIARRLTKLVKKNSSSLVIWGGIHPTISPESCIDEADMLCIGEGEGAIADLARHIRDNKPYQSINNLWVRNNGHVIKNPMRPLIQDLDSLPFPSWGNNSYYFIDSNRIIKKDPLFLETDFRVQTSRGCPYSCSFCINSLLKPQFKDLGHYIRKRSVGNVIREIKEYLSLPKNYTNYIYFVDDSFGNEESWLNEFELQYKKEVGLPFWAIYNPKRINSSMLGKLTRAGLHTVNIGIQSGSDYIRNQIFHRSEKSSEIIDLAREIKNYGVKIVYDLINGDNPYETEQFLKETIEFLLQLPKELEVDLFRLQYFPNYPLTKRLLEDGHIQPKEVSLDSLMERTRGNWRFIPSLLPYTKEQILKNIIWLIAKNHVKNSTVKYALLDNSLGSKLCLIYLNFKSIVLAKILDIGGIAYRFRWILYFILVAKYILRGDLKTIFFEMRRHLLIAKLLRFVGCLRKGLVRFYSYFVR